PTACLLRYTVFSLVYLFYLLLLPWFFWPNKHTVRGPTGLYIKGLFCTSLVFVLAHVCFQTMLYTYPPLYTALADNCTQWDMLSKHIGLSRLSLDDPWGLMRQLCPDVGVCMVALVTMVLCSQISKNRELLADETMLSSNMPAEKVSTATRAKQLAQRLRTTAHEVLQDVGRILTICLLALAGITLPSTFSAVYFILFIGLCTWWACHLPISPVGFNALCVMVGFFTAGHMVCLYLYQSQVAQSLFPPESLWARLFGLKDIIQHGNCSAPSDLIVNLNHDWPVYVNPGILLLLYITIAIVLKTSNLCPAINPEGENPFFVMGRVVMQQSYVCALIAMMVWSITYHSWLTFVLLLWACLIWIVRSRRHVAMLCSPFILFYGLALCSLQFIWAMEFQLELPNNVGLLSLRQLGLDRAQYPCLRLGAMLLFTLTFWLLLRQSMKEIFSRKIKMFTQLQEVNTRVLKVVGGVVMSCYAKYWIYVCGGMFIMVSFAGKLVGYKIVYMLLFLLCLCLYQVYYSLWRKLLKVFWWLVVAYTMLILISIYTYQFEDFPGYWRNLTGFTEEQLADIGLETFALSELFSSILIPGFFLLACILQLHYFHTPFMSLTDLEHVNPLHRMEVSALMPSKWGLVMDRLLVLCRQFSDTLTQTQEFLWRLLELHIVKMVAFYTVWVALGEPSVMNLLLVVLWSLAMPYGRFRPMASCLSTVWVCVIIVCKMLYQLVIVNPDKYSNNCSLPFANMTNLSPEQMKNSTLYKGPVDPANWFGFRKDATVLGYSKNHLVVLMLLVFEATVYRHQIHHYCQVQCSPPAVQTLFPAATRDTLDQGLMNGLKYLLNYAFYKFGLEICFLMTINVIGQRMNFVVIIHGCWLVIIIVRRRRAAMARIWPKYCLFLCVFMIYQYVLCVGMPPALCIDYPWRWNTPVMINSALIKWIYLPDFYTEPNSQNLIADFVLLMCASQQWKVFENERTEDWMVLAGENTDCPDPMENQLFNPTPNFINCRCYLDMAKVLVFRYLYWFVLSVVFVTGATRISVFGLGYLLACFFFFLFGTQLLVKPARARLAVWDCLIIYNVAVIIAKNLLSILACVFVVGMQKDFCWVIQLFSLVCTVKGYYDPKSVGDKTCTLPVEEAGIIWDSICFLFLLLQRRVFLSFYFLHVTAELQASAKQASRGFELFRASLVKDMTFHQKAEEKSLSQLKRSKITNDWLFTLPDPSSRPDPRRKTPKRWHQPWMHHATVLHSGEYYLFESDSEDEEDTPFEEPTPQKQTACQLAYQAWVTSVKAALRDRQRRQRELRRLERGDKSKERDNRSNQEAGLESGHGAVVQRILDILRFLWAIVLAMVDGLSEWLNLLTKQYRDTSTVLCKERYLHIHKIGQVMSTDNTRRVFLAITGWSTVPPAVYDGGTEQSSESTSCSTVRLAVDSQFFIEELEQSRDFYAKQNRLLKLLFALYSLLAANSELVCYLIIVLNNVVSASAISLVLPILVFLWAMLAVPRPTKKFWMTAIIYTEVMVVVKYLFQFGFFPWNSVYEMTLNEDKPFFTPRILGLEKTDNYIRYDLLQLLALFFHRSLLMVSNLSYYLGQMCVFLWSPSKSFAFKRHYGSRLMDLLGPTLRRRYGLWHQEGPLEENTAANEDGMDRERQGREKEEAARGSDEDVFQRGVANATGNIISCYLLPFFSSSVQDVYRPTRCFFVNILHTEYRAATDVYALMFLTDVVDFIIIVFGFWAFGKHSAAADIASSLSDDQVPEAFLVMLLIQFSTMIIDRALYLRKTVLGKLIFQIILVFGIHLWMFFILPAVTERMFNQNFVAQLWYFVKCIYFGLSAYQIRCGYPTRILGNFLTKGYNHLNLFLFQGFRLVPFLVELRAVMDWVWTDTTLSLSNWMCVEDIYANIFIIKCSRETEKKYPQPKGQKKKKIVKYGMGGLIIFFLICIIWFPLLFISLVRSVVGVVNHPIDVTVTVKLGGYEPLFTMSAQQQSIQPFSEADYDRLTTLFGDNAVAMQFITFYSSEDIVTARIEGSSGSVWRISPPSRQEVVKELMGSPGDLTLRLAWNFQRDLGKGGTVEHSFDKHSINLEPGNPVRADLASLLVGNRTEPVRIPHMFPNYIRAPNGAEAKPVTQLYEGDEDGYQNVTLSLMSDRSLNRSGTQEWWDIAIDDCKPSTGSCRVLPMIIFNDKVSPPSLGFLAGYGIMGLYVSVVLVIGKFVRGFFSEISHSIMFEELPCVDRILKLCTDIFLVRETGELELEEELYSKLIFLYRSPETMIKWTRDMQVRGRRRN
uniref:Piezo type mechanosensitive ion channel component 1 (Er blood group) n=1 Tax=Gadus morhua TaxID=8049 RepID=A0A8C5CZG7_GADMO